jgi:membrane protein
MPRRGRSPSRIDGVLAPGLAMVALAVGLAKAFASSRDDRSARPAPALTVDDDVAGAPGHEPVERLPGMLGRIQALSTRRGLGWVYTAVRVQQRVGDQHGNFLAGAISLAAFLALFPLLLVALSVAGFISHGHGDVTGSVIEHLGLSGAAASEITNALRTAQTSATATGLIGLLGLFWTGLGVIGAMQYAYNQIWQVKARGLKDRLVGVEWLAGAVVLFAASAFVTALLAVLPGILSPVALLLALLTDVALFWWTAKVLPNRDVGWRPLLPGAILGGVGLEVLKFVGGFYVPNLVKHSSELYGSIGVVFALLAWLLLFGKLIVYAATLDVILWERRAGTVKAIIEIPRHSNETEETTRSGAAEPRSSKPTVAPAGSH